MEGRVIMFQFREKVQDVAVGQVWVSSNVNHPFTTASHDRSHCP